MPAVRVPIEHRPDLSAFRAHVDGRWCTTGYRLVDGVMDVTHTEVPPPLQGRGIAAALVAAAVEYARTHRLKINPVCTYARVWLKRHPELHDLLVR